LLAHCGLSASVPFWFRGGSGRGGSGRGPMDDDQVALDVDIVILVLNERRRVVSFFLALAVTTLNHWCC
jgi:hypothetical protein